MASAREIVIVGHIRGHGCRDLLVYCSVIGCNHHAVMSGDRFEDSTPIRPLGARMVCSSCGHRGADVRPDWRPHVTASRTK